MRYADPSLGRAGAFFTAICGLLNPLFRSGLDNYVAGVINSQHHKDHHLPLLCMHLTRSYLGVTDSQTNISVRLILNLTLY